MSAGDFKPHQSEIAHLSPSQKKNNSPEIPLSLMAANVSAGFLSLYNSMHLKKQKNDVHLSSTTNRKYHSILFLYSFPRLSKK